jgi:hypothetical protein
MVTPILILTLILNHIRTLTPNPTPIPIPTLTLTLQVLTNQGSVERPDVRTCRLADIKYKIYVNNITGHDMMRNKVMTPCARSQALLLRSASALHSPDEDHS